MAQRQGNTLHAAELNAALADTPLAGHLHHLPQTPSTNDLALAAAQRGLPAGAWVADAQTAGRGRGGHTWHSSPGDGLYLSVLLRPQLPASAFDLAFAAGLAAFDAVRDTTGITTDIRWPNDLVTRDHPRSRKLGGVLVESALRPPTAPGLPATLRYAVLGIGLNVAHRHFPPDLALLATSLFLEGWQLPDRQPLLLALLHHLLRNIAQMEHAHATHAPSPLRPRLAAASTWLHGKRVQVPESPENPSYTGLTAGLDPQGFLLIRTPNGTLHTIRNGGVREA